MAGLLSPNPAGDSLSAPPAVPEAAPDGITEPGQASSAASLRRFSPSLIALIFTLSTALFLTWFMAFRFVLSNDEGIFLEGALRILHGQVPYRDFFLLMGPGTFWLQALALKTLGVTLAASRATTVFDISVLTGCVVWLIARHVGTLSALWFGWLFVVFETCDPVVLLPNHRWDSAAFAMLAITILAGLQPGSADPASSRMGNPILRWMIALLAGACAGCAAWITPTTALIGFALIVWMVFEDRVHLVPFVAGVSLVTLACAGVLASQHALRPMIDHMLWSSRNYGAVNHMYYGSRVGGYAWLFQHASGTELFTVVLLVLTLSLPAFLPPLGLACFWPDRGDRQFRLLAAGGFAFVASTYPRMDVPHLVYAVPVFYVLLARGASRLKMQGFAKWGAVAISILAAIFLYYGISLRSSEVVLHTRVGTIRASGDDVGLIQQIGQQVAPHDSFFSFPYSPMGYFLTLGENPTRYSYLQPGMMDDADESAALEELKAHPPHRVFYEDLSAREILVIWPATDPARLKLHKIEDYLATHYRVHAAIPYHGGAFAILEPRD